jgi:hypothetical protein
MSDCVVHVLHKDDNFAKTNITVFLCCRDAGKLRGSDWDYTYKDTNGDWVHYKPAPTCTSCILLALSEPETIFIKSNE